MLLRLSSNQYLKVELRLYLIFSTTISTTITNANCHGEARQPPYKIGQSSSSHGTPCCSQAYGRTLGMAWGSVKWAISYNTVGAEKHIDIMKLFHLHKPKDKRGNTRPTVFSTSWSGKAYVDVYDRFYNFNNGASSSTGSWVDALSAPFPAFLVPHRAAHGFTPRSWY